MMQLFRMAHLEHCYSQEVDLVEWGDKITFGLRRDYISISPKWLLKKIEA